MNAISKFPNEMENSIVTDFKNSLKKHKTKFTTQKFERSIKIYVNDGFTRATFHIYNVEDVKK